jgi:Flp pilus assembly protein TadD
LAAASKAVADTLQAQLDAFRQKTGKSGEAPRLPSDPQTQEKLAALGYMSASALAPAPAAIGTGVDPKDKIEVGNMMAHASTLMEDKRFDEAVLVLQQVIAKDPDMIVAYSKLGTAEAALGNFAEAIKAKRKAVELAPDSPDLHFELGNVLVRAQDFEAAIPELEGVAAEMQQQWRARMLLALAYSRTNRLPQAINECEKVLAVLPEQYGTNLLLGRVLLRSGKAETALPRLSKAASLRPQAPEPHLSLAAAYAMLGRDDDAEREQAMGERLAENR